jgi:hypothetical protein
MLLLFFDQRYVDRAGQKTEATTVSTRSARVAFPAGLYFFGGCDAGTTLCCSAKVYGSPK